MKRVTPCKRLLFVVPLGQSQNRKEAAKALERPQVDILILILFPLGSTLSSLLNKPAIVCLLVEFPRVAVANDHRSGGLNQE